MTNDDEAAAVRPLTLPWVSRHLEVGERIVRTEALHGGITAEMRRLTIGKRDGGTRDLVLRTFVNVEDAEDWLSREAGALTRLPGTGVLAPGLVAVDPTAAHCEYPLLLMTHLAGRTVLDDEGLETRVPLCETPSPRGPCTRLPRRDLSLCVTSSQEVRRGQRNGTVRVTGQFHEGM